MALGFRERLGSVGVERGQAVEEQHFALELRECLRGVGVERGQAVEDQCSALKPRQYLGGVGVERGQAVDKQTFALELRERLGSVGIECGQAVEAQRAALELRERLRAIGVERGQAVEVQMLALENRQCLDGVGVERGQAVEDQRSALELRECLRGAGVERGWADEIQIICALELRHEPLCLLRRQALDRARVRGELVGPHGREAERHAGQKHGDHGQRKPGEDVHGGSRCGRRGRRVCGPVAARKSTTAAKPGERDPPAPNAQLTLTSRTTLRTLPPPPSEREYAPARSADKYPPEAH